jgi:endoglucanase|tara:strand:+ start:239 stop:1096 length:858 start_codon:yes stop_codon:yes gene_type:complete
MSLNYPFWVNNFDRVKDHKIQYPLASKIFEHPVSFWYGERNGKTIEKLSDSLTRLFARTAPQLPVLVVYNLPNRDMGHYSKGGATSWSSYMRFLEDFTDGLGSNEVIIIYEPDALPHSTLMSDFEAEWRIKIMKKGLETLTRSNAHVYIDIGHSNWLSPKEANDLLDKVSNDKVRGFAVNVSNYRSTQESLEWGSKVCEHRPNDHFIIDTSRNGNGPHGNEWCNPPGRSLGIPPTCDTGNEKCDAFLWIKIPGESDGKANKGPKAGKFWGEMAEELVTNIVKDNK